MPSRRPEVYLNQFKVKQLTEAERPIYQYRYTFTTPPEEGKRYSAINRILYQIGDALGIRLGDVIATTSLINEDNLAGDNWQLSLIGEKLLDPKVSGDRKALEQIQRKILRQKLRRSRTLRIEDTRSGFSGFILWDTRQVKKEGNGWRVLKGALVDVVVDNKGDLYLEIDHHYRFQSPWTLHQWLESEPDAPLNYVQNIHGGYSWHFVAVSTENPEEVYIPDLNQSLADYHHSKGIDRDLITNSRVVYVEHTGRKRSKNNRTPHLSQLLAPSLSMEMLGYRAEQGDLGAKQVMTTVRQAIQSRIDKGQSIANFLMRQCYSLSDPAPQPRPRIATLCNPPNLIAQNGTPVKQSADALRKGCLKVGELNFGCLCLQNVVDTWPGPIRDELSRVATKNNVTLNLNCVRFDAEMSDNLIERRQFWQAIANNNVKTMLVVSRPSGLRVGKTQLRREALQAGIALQFMHPMPTNDNYRAANITLGLLIKAQWQAIGLTIPNPEAAELVIGFDAGTNHQFFYGTSAFAVLADGQSLGWEIPEVQSGEKFSGQAICNATANVLERFRQLNKRLSKKVLLLRDGFVRDREFDLTLATLTQANIEADLLEVRKSGAGRIAQKIYDQYSNTEKFIDAQPGTAFSTSNNSFRIITSRAKAGGSPQPLEIRQISGDTSLPTLTEQIFALSQFHPASGFSASRLPMPLHYADKMIKAVQKMNNLSLLHNINRQKIFFA